MTTKRVSRRGSGRIVVESRLAQVVGGSESTSQAGRAVEVKLPPYIFDVEPSIPTMHQVVVAQLAAARQGTHSTKTRAEVRGGGRKPYRQKGTGRARQGSTRAPHFVGGGKAFGPKPRDYSHRTPKKMKVAALRGALSDRARNNRIHVLDGYNLGERPSTKSARRVLESIVDDFSNEKFLCVLMRDDAVEWQSMRNLQNVHLLAVDQLNTHDVLYSDHVVFTVDSYRWLVEANQNRQRREEDPSQPAKGTAWTDLSSASGGPVPSVPTRIKQPALVVRGKDAHQNPILTAAHEAAGNMTNVASYRSSEPTVDGWSVSSDDVEYVAVERHTDHVLATWPTTMTADDALSFFQAIPSRVEAVYASGDEYYEATGGEKIDWRRVAGLTNMTFVRVDLEGQSLMWETPDEDALLDNRFILIEPRMGSQPLLSLVRSTTKRDVLGLINEFLSTENLDLRPLNAG